MMITNELIEIQDWYANSLKKAASVAINSAARDLYRQEAIKAMDEYYETYGKVMPFLFNHYRGY